MALSSPANSEDDNITFSLMQSCRIGVTMDDTAERNGQFLKHAVTAQQAPGATALAVRYDRIIHETSRRPHSLCSSPVRFVDDSSDSSPEGARPRLVSRLSADNLLLSPAASTPDMLNISRDRSKAPRRSISQDPGTGGIETDDSSMDSLAKQTLLAAQVLNLIPVMQARERNFLQGRVATNSMLGPKELDRVLKDRTLTIFVGTWNMNGQSPPVELNDLLLPGPLENIPDVIVVGTQESHPDKFEWEVKMQETIGPSHLLFHSASLGTLNLSIFLRRDLIWYASVAEDDSESVRPGTAFRTKGAVAVCFMVFGTSLLFISAHLTAHQDKVKERISDVKKIVRSIDLPKNFPSRNRLPTKKDVTQNFDFVFWCGDLNFRLSQPREDVMQWAELSPVQVDMNGDQLNDLITKGMCLREFQEGEITFPPTYKYDPGTQNFDTSSKQRTPAYTDRILFKGKAGTVKCLAYQSVSSITTSDHKPVWGVYSIPVRPGKDSIPLAAGLFNRDVFLEGINRRINLRQEEGLSSVCVLQ